MSDLELVGPVRHPRNASQDERGGIHDDATATGLGFRGGTIAGSIHLDQLPPLLVDVLGPAWFERGGVSLYFRHALTDGEPVRAVVGRPPTIAAADDVQVPVRMEQPDGGPLVAEGTASLGVPATASALRSRDLRDVDPTGLRILRLLAPGIPLGPFTYAADGDEQRDRIERGFMTEPLGWYTGPSPWGGPIAAPSTVVDLLSRPPTKALIGLIGKAVGLWGAMEIVHHRGPVLVDEPYEVRGQVVAVAETPQTEVLWYDTTAYDAAARPVATLRLMTRFMKASSSLYATAV